MGSIRDSILGTEDEATPLKKKLDEFGTFLAKICVLHSVHYCPVTAEYGVNGTTYAPEGAILDNGGSQLDIPAQQPCLIHIAMCSALCNDSSLQYNSDKGTYEKIGKSTEVAICILAEKIGIP